jgi:hypothetical protein
MVEVASLSLVGATSTPLPAHIASRSRRRFEHMPSLVHQKVSRWSEEIILTPEQPQSPWAATETKQLSHWDTVQDHMSRSVSISIRPKERSRQTAFFSLDLRPRITSRSLSVSTCIVEILQYTHRPLPKNHTRRRRYPHNRYRNPTPPIVTSRPKPRKPQSFFKHITSISPIPLHYYQL